LARRDRRLALRSRPDCLWRKLGREVDLFVSCEEPRRGLEAELSARAFRAGEAFGPEKGEGDLFVGAKVNFNFWSPFRG
jgi:hypothetical protein